MVTQKLIIMYDTYQQKDSEGRSIECKKCRSLSPELHTSFLTSAGFNLFFFCSVHIWLILQNGWVSLVLSVIYFPLLLFPLLLSQSTLNVSVLTARGRNRMSANLNSKASTNTADTNGALQVEMEPISSVIMKTAA